MPLTESKCITTGLRRDLLEKYQLSQIASSIHVHKQFFHQQLPQSHVPHAQGTLTRTHTTYLCDVLLHHHARDLLLDGAVRLDLAAELRPLLGVLRLTTHT